MAGLLWVALVLFAGVGLFFGRPFRKVRGAMVELGVLLGVYLLLTAALIVSIAVEGLPDWQGGTGDWISVLIGVSLGVLWGLRLWEWSSASLHSRFAY